MTVDDMTIVRCANCAWQGPASQCDELKDILKRVNPGDVMPFGECPDCGMACHEVKNGGAAVQPADINDVLLMAAAFMEDWESDEGVTDAESLQDRKAKRATLDRVTALVRGGAEIAPTVQPARDKATAEEIERARDAHQTEEIEIDDETEVSRCESCTWVKAWVMIDKA